MKPLTAEEIAELRKLAEGGRETALEWRAAVLAAHPFLLDEVERSRALLKRIEWAGEGGDEIIASCPECEIAHDDGDDLTHAPGCDLAALLGGG